MNPKIEDMTTEDLALALNQQYQTLIQCQNNIMLINQVVEGRKNDRTKTEDND